MSDHTNFVHRKARLSADRFFFLESGSTTQSKFRLAFMTVNLMDAHLGGAEKYLCFEVVCVPLCVLGVHCQRSRSLVLWHRI